MGRLLVIKVERIADGVAAHNDLQERFRRLGWEALHPEVVEAKEIRLEVAVEGALRLCWRGVGLQFPHQFEHAVQSAGRDDYRCAGAMRPIALARRNSLNPGNEAAGPRIAAIISIG